MRPERRSVPGLAEKLPALEASLQPDASPRNVMRVAEGLWLLGRSDRAVDLLTPLVNGAPSLVAPRVLMSWCYEDAGKAAEARQVRRRIAELDPANPFGETEAEEPPVADPAPGKDSREIVLEPDAAVPAGEAEAEPERSLTEAELKEVPPGPLYSATLAEIFAKQGFQEKAIEIYRRLEKLSPESDDVRSRIRALEEQAGGTTS